MLIYAELTPSQITPYHKNLARVKGREEYAALRASIAENGIQDALLLWGFPDRLEVHVGEQRLLIAEELGIETLRCLIAPVKGTNVRSLGVEVTNPDKYFSNPDCPTIKTIRNYIESSIIVL
jgi:ParB-like chromosome segregation protein Spo0J